MPPKKKTYKSKLNTQSFIASSRTNFFSSIGIKNPTLDNFKTFLQKNMETLKNKGLPKPKQTPSYCGGICLQQLIIGKLNKLKSKNINKKQLENRLSYFKSDAFIQNFINALPTRDKANKSALETSYSIFFNDLFNVNYAGWRDDKLSKIDNQTQCRRALGIAPSVKIVDLQEPGNIKCYLCGRNILSSVKTNQSTMECEHVLPIITALSHWWLIKDKNHSSTEIENLSFEYDWSHRCCNQLKSNIDFIVYDASPNFEYKVNMLMINSVLNKIKTEAKYDCKEIKPKSMIQSNQHLNIAKRIQPIIDEINANALQFDSHSEYLLLTKYKVLSALSDDDFLQSIIGNDDNNNNNYNIPKRKDIRQIIIEKRAWLMRMQQEEKQRMESKIKMQSEARINRLNTRIQGGMDNITDEEILEYDLPGYNEFNTFDDSVMIKSILTNKRFDPTLKELTDTFEKIFMNNTFIQWDPNTDAAHSFFVETNKPKITTFNKQHGLLPMKIPINPFLPKHRTTVKRNYTVAELEKTKKTGLLPKNVVKNLSSSSSESSNRQSKKRRISL